jgi:hypothetical protein
MSYPYQITQYRAIALLEDVDLTVADTDAPRRVAQLMRGLPHVLHPADAQLLKRNSVVSRRTMVGPVVSAKRALVAEMSGQDESLIDTTVAEESVRGLGSGPILAGHGDGGANPLAQIAEELSQASFQSLVGKPALLLLASHPVVHVGGLEKRLFGMTAACRA